MTSRCNQNCSLPTAHWLELILVVIVVVIFFFDDVQFDWIQSDDFELKSTFFATYCLTFVHIRIDVNFGFTFRACSGRHLFTSSYLARHWPRLPIRLKPTI